MALGDARPGAVDWLAATVGPSMLVIEDVPAGWVSLTAVVVSSLEADGVLVETCGVAQSGTTVSVSLTGVQIAALGDTVYGWRLLSAGVPVLAGRWKSEPVPSAAWQSVSVVVGGGVRVVVSGASGFVGDPAGTAATLVAAEAVIRAAADVALDGRLDVIEAVSIATDAELAAAVALRLALAGGTMTGEIIQRGPLFDVRAFGAVGDGTTDDTTAVQAAINAASTAGGGIVYIPAKTFRCNGQLTIPTDGAAQPEAKPIWILGAGAHHSGRSTSGLADLTGGSVLDLRYSGSAAKLVTTGYGRLRIESVAIADLGTANTTPYVLTTNTTLLCSDVSFWGNPAKSQGSCNQTAIMLGVTPGTPSNSLTAPFQGYGTTIERCSFHRMQLGVWGRGYSNGVTVRDNVWWASCGGTEAILFDGGDNGTDYSVGGTISNNLIECIAYTRAIRLKQCNNFTVIANHFYDASGIAVAYIVMDTNAAYNMVIAGHYTSSKPLVSPVGTNTVIDMAQSQYTEFAQPVRFANVTPVEIENLRITGNAGMVVRIDGAASDSNQLLNLQAPGGTNVLLVQEAGNMTFTGSQGGAIDGTSHVISASEWRRKTTGGTMTINSGTGGSYLILQNYGVQIKDHTAALQLTIGAGGANINAASGKTLDLQTNATSRIKMNSTGIGFFAATPAAKPTVTGSRGGNAALASLITALATLGLVTDSSTA